ncbi:MAG: hypothetical protein AB1428_11635 [Bacteroidota bacterium]
MTGTADTRRITRLIAGAVLLLGGAADVRGQYVERTSYDQSTSRYIAAGAFAREFAPRSSNDAPDSLVIRYARVMPFLMYRNGVFDVTFGYAQYDLDGRSCSAIFLSTTVMTELPLAGTRETALVLPLLVAADFSKSEAAGSKRDDFNVASIGIGTGLKFRSRGEGVDLSIGASGVIHYSFPGYSIRSGSSPAVLGEVAALFHRVPVAGGIAAGYRFRLQSWSTGGFFDYRTVNHGLFVGVMF